MLERISLLVIAALAILQASAAKSTGQTAFLPSFPSTPRPQDARNAEMEALLDKYAPIFMLSETELFFPSSVEYMLKHYTYVEHQNGTAYIPNKDILTTSHLNLLPNNGTQMLLSVNVEHNAQPRFPHANSSFMYGPAGQEGAMQYDENGRGIVKEPVYGFWVDQGRGVVDLWYWTFYPYNLGKLIGTFGWLGNHVVDWEHLRVRTVNGTAVSVDFDTHSGGSLAAGTFRWEEAPHMDGRPVAYVASGSHGTWPNPGKHVYAQLLNLWALVDVTDDRGPIWDTKGRVVPIQFWDGPENMQKTVHAGDRAWLEYRGKWGNRKKSCWWKMFFGICQLVDGPPGPDRRFGLPPQCTVSKAAESVSTFSFWIANSVVAQVAAHNVTTIAVEQICARPDKPLRNHAVAPRSTVVKNTLPFRGRQQYTATTVPCRGSRNAMKAYRLVLYDGDHTRITTSPARVLCVEEAGREGWVASSAVSVDDPDEWNWDVFPHDTPTPPDSGDDDDPINRPGEMKGYWWI